MVWHLLLILAAASLFFIAIPAVGAFVARGQWWRFRAAMTVASRYPTATAAWVGRERGTPPGRCRFFGALEAIQGDNRIWVSNGRFSVAVDLRGVRVFLIPDASAGEEESGTVESGTREGGTGLASVPWSRIFSLPEGTPMFVAGTFVTEEGRGVFRTHALAPLLVVIHDCPREHILMRAIGSGRQRNEYMNTLTLPSVGIGSLTLLLLAFTFLGIPEKLPGLIAFTAALAPIVPFLPPGFPLYFAYRSAWKKARLLRAQRDVVLLPLRFPATAGAPRGRRGTLLPDLEPYAMMRGVLEGDEGEVLLTEGARIPLPPHLARLAVDLPAIGRRRERGAGMECVVFGGYTIEGEEVRLSTTEDPMAGLLLVPGIPEAIARASDKGARRFTTISALFISLNVAVNAPLVFVLLALLMR